ncbi:MAG: alanine dehydrogenase [Candidatus Nanoarchaeia archaeon]
MMIATLKEVKDKENRVGLSPAGAKALIRSGSEVLVQKGAGVNAGFSDADYRKAGAKIVSSATQIVKKADIIVKVKEPIKSEYKLLDKFKGKTLFTYLHLAAVDKQLTLRLMRNNITAIAYETVEDNAGRLPLLRPMSQVAGVLSIQYAAQYLQNRYGGRGITLGKVDNTDTAHVVVVGGGTVGSTAAKTAAGLGCEVAVIQRKGPRLKKLSSYFREELGSCSKNIKVIPSTPANISRAVKSADVLVGSVLIKGARTPRIVTKDMVKKMKEGAVIVDVAIDQGGCIWGSRPTSHSDPIYMLMGKVYCCITNMPGQVSHQATQALTQATLPYVLKMSKGVEKALRADKGLAKGVNVKDGNVAYKAVAESLKLKCVPI